MPNDYEFIDDNIEYQITKDQLFIRTNQWAEIHKQDFIFLAKRLGVNITKEQRELFDAVVDSNKRLQTEVNKLRQEQDNEQ